MPWLTFIADELLENIVNQLLVVANNALKKVESHFEKNVVDPFAAVFEMAGFKIDEQIWRANEKTRKAQKTLTNRLGDFHPDILSNVMGWNNPGRGGIIDLISTERKIIAEIKNKYNTVKGSDLIHLYTNLELLVMPKTSKFKDYTAYYVEIIPKKTARYDVPFTPSDKTTGKRKEANPLIRKIDGFSFYQLVTGVDDALLQLFNVLPKVIESSQYSKHYQFKDIQFLNHIFNLVFGSKV